MIGFLALFILLPVIIVLIVILNAIGIPFWLTIPMSIALGITYYKQDKKKKELKDKK